MADHNAKTSTFVIDHDRCNPTAWNAMDILAFADFISTGDLQRAAHLARLGVQLVASEHHVPKGGALQDMGWIKAGDEEARPTDDLLSLDLEENIEVLTPVYHGPSQYAALYHEGDGDGGAWRNWKIFATRAEAEAFSRSTLDGGGEQEMQSAPPAIA